MNGDRVDRSLWIAFGLLFAVVIGASVLPVRPLVWAFPVWAAVVLGACVGTVSIAILTVRAGWPAEASQR